ncbi:MAG TPA: chromosomal replication initiator protein DnaA [bacterium]|nr:chromosomal replication initiator protein DnaA [bacterium]
MTTEDLWKTTLAQIEVKLDSPAQYQTWFKDTKLIEIDGKKAKIAVKNSYASDWLKKKHDLLIKSTLSYVYGKDLIAVYEVRQDASVEEAGSDSEVQAPILDVQGGIDFQTRDVLKEAGLSDRYSFSNFVVGSSNKLAHAASQSIAEGTGKNYNPLFIYGPTGLGKTHLAQAIGRQFVEKDSESKVVYCASEKFLNDMVRAIKSGKNVEFREKYRTVDLFIMDDIQQASKWQGTQTEFFNTFNVLFQANKQIVLISDRPPEEIENLEARLKSRFQGGMVVDIVRPDFETRKAILEKKSKEFGLDVHEKLIEMIARIIKDNVRELEGALQKISLFDSMSENEITKEEVQRILGRDAKSKREKVKVPSILKRIAREYGITVKDIKGPKRTAEIAFARQVSMYILREEFEYKLERVAQLLNRKDHTTVIHAVDKIKSKMMSDEGFKEQMEMLTGELQSAEI